MLGKWLQWQCEDALHAIKCGIILPNGQSITSAQDGYPTVKFLSWKTIFQLPFQPSLAIGEAYANGTMIIHDGTLYDALKAMIEVKENTQTTMLSKLTTLYEGAFLYRKDGRRRAQSAHNIHSHYDIGNAFYDLFLDPDLQYSCGYFPDLDTDLAEAQVAKKAHIAKKLMLTKKATVLDIGCGWGGLGLTLARDHGASVTGITLSKEQLITAQARAAKEPDLPVDFIYRDYRDETQLYDHIVSVGMFEHVGKKQFPIYFRAIDRLLKKDGVAVIHTIGSSLASSGSDPFISKYIFPGGYIPKLSEIMTSIEQTSLRVTDIEVWHDHYAKTLRCWRERFMAKRDEALAMFDDRFCRIWEFYLAGCELAFSHSQLVVYQIQISKSKGVVPISRDYLYR
ncbi:MAG TPA: SAM-dependent methyltransferase [Alphaproteobacteria bacterium]|nr:SAM-dependent methyltransferase [Alphaproteobacteria bacterium]